jgi:hypothetical protein
MKDRRSLMQGLEETPPVDPELERQIVFQGKLSTPRTTSPATPPPTPTVTLSRPRAPVSTRLRADLAEALKRASLERQLQKLEPSAINEILEAALEPWLKSNGYLR